ncbi:MAG: tRNA threonylcarbamoyladenosine dehydratase [Candidatus Gastranaerophilales bacterium]|nr:tRNA threonylcarbamoyladenosine dehydratase [Candidatus Gastranaerophilales bacterium]
MQNNDIFQRNEMFWGKEFQQYLQNVNVAVFGIGGVGSYAAEALARSGIGCFTIIDFDKTAPSNINRQLIATCKTLDKYKVDLMRERILQINPTAKVNAVNDFYTSDMNSLFEKNFDFVLDAIDSFAFKTALIGYCMAKNINIISSMGAANRIDPSQLYIADLKDVTKTNCAFASRIINRLKKDGIKEGLAMVLSSEKPIKPEKHTIEEKITTNSGQTIEYKKITPATTPFVAPCAGIIMASYVLQKLLENKKQG